MTATPDALTWREDMPGPGTLQIKLTRMAQRYQEETPRDVWCQLQHEMAVTGLKWGQVAALLQGVELVWQKHVRDEEFIREVLAPSCRDFMESVRKQEPYVSKLDIYDPKGVKRALKAIYPMDAGESVSLEGKFVELYEERERLKKQLSETEKRVGQIDNQFHLAMKDATWGILPNGIKASLKTTSVPAQVVHKDAYSFRVLRFSKGKE